MDLKNNYGVLFETNNMKDQNQQRTGPKLVDLLLFDQVPIG